MTDRAPIIVICALGVVLVLLFSAVALMEKAHQRAEAYCQDHQMVLVETAAGERCAPLWALERTSR